MQVSECVKLCEEMRQAKKNNAMTYKQSTNTESIDHEMCKTYYCAISSESHRKITDQVKSTKPMLEAFFNTQLADSFEQPKYLQYAEGHFFAPHTDEQLKRKINISINLNNGTSQTGEAHYQGGILQLYGLIKEEAFSNRGFAAPATAGCLIAYPVDVVHEVTPVTAGSRFAIVSRFNSKH